VVESTVLTGVSIPSLLQAHADSGAAATVALGHDPLVSEPSDGHLHPAGVWVFERSALSEISELGYQDIKEVLIPRLHAQNRPVYGYEVHGPCPRVRNAASYLAVNEWMLRRWLETTGEIADYEHVAAALVHRTARVDAAARLLGPVVVGPHTFVAAGAVVLGPTVLGGHCRVGPDALVSRSVLWDHAEAQFGSQVDQSIVTNGASVTSRARVSNQIYMPERLQPLRFSGELVAARPPAARPVAV
jgi:mannose-1-phosphate guanylyltransferase